jgi:hypothetical protein
MEDHTACEILIMDRFMKGCLWRSGRCMEVIFFGLFWVDGS